MSSWKKTREKLLLGASDANMDFEAVCTMLRHLGFSERKGRGSHRIFWRAGLRKSLTYSRAAAKVNHISKSGKFC
jgi:predicted RNA binding protein YcfA (HicA-like mRNA interferase family)